MSEEIKAAEIEQMKQNLAEIAEIAKKREEKEVKNGHDLADYKAEQAKAAEDFMRKFEAFEKQSKELELKNHDLEAALAKLQFNVPAEEAGISQKSLEQFNSYVSQKRDCNLSQKEALLAQRAFDKYVTGKEHLISNEEKAVINSIVDPDGGFVVAPGYDPMLVNRKFDLQGVLSLVEIKNIQNNSYSQAVDDSDYSSSEYLNELANADPEEHNPAYEIIKWNPTEQIFKFVMTRTELEDSFIRGGIDQDVIAKAREGIIRQTAAQVLVGNGVDRPRGILTYADGVAYDKVEQVTATASTSISWEDVLQVLPAKLADPYHAAAAYLMKRETFLSLLVSKDSNGQFKLLNQVNFLSGAGSSMQVMGRPVVFDASMADVSTAGNLCVLFGDFKEAYAYVERVGFGIIIDNVTDGQRITYRIRRRNDGRLKMGRALKALKVKA